MLRLQPLGHLSNLGHDHPSYSKCCRSVKLFFFFRRNVPFGRTQFAPTLWTKSVTVGAQSLRPPIDWDIIPTQVPKHILDIDLRLLP
ncbi:MAG: hypothetical protein EWV60_02950 [Microcystis sp. Msp_OC_L_20101000_S702]|nr:MAG: hypothetical protein EWV60_02950 [Microcystis sp. Msp_OC_L_20101000_S702]